MVAEFSAGTPVPAHCIKGAETSSKVTHHLSTSQLERFCAGALSEDELTSVAMHLADCRSCHERFVEELRRKNGSGPFAFTLAPEACFRHDHLDFDQLVDLADEKLDQCTREVIDVHLRACETCREDVRSFLAFRKAETRATEESCTEAG
jgi:anti-sigma factor ChrR (cupin superfamily)